MKKIIIIILTLGVLAGGFLFFYKKVNSPALSEIKSFEDCIKAGYPIMESYPRQCKTPDGRTFAEEITPSITYKNASTNLIVVDLPFPGAVTGKTFKVVGKARGVWFFEASFPIELLDNNGKVIAVGIAQAQSDWMTESFVPFEAEIKAPVSYVGPATLLLKKDNPSGLPEHDASASFPITVEY